MGSSEEALAGKVVVVTGAGRGQGAAEVRACAAAGATVIATDVDGPAARALASEVGGIGFEHDVSDDADWRRIAGVVAHDVGPIDGLVNNAGVFSSESLLDGSVATTRRVWEVNQLGVYLGMKRIAPLMPDGGSIVNISSIGGLRGYPAFAYAASKWAVTGMTKSAARELAARGIRVNSIHPGLVDTPMLGDTDPARVEQLTASVPLGRMATPDDIVGAVLFLLGPSANYLTGSEIVIDGGLIA